MRTTVVAVGLGFLLIAPASWAVQTLGHATNGTFRAGGPSTVAAGGFGGFGGGPGPGGSLSTDAIVYARQHGGGTIAVAGQMGASRAIIDSGARIAALGGFSGRESEVSVAWLADAVRTGKIRWVSVDGSGGFGPGRDGRVGASRIMAAVAQTCTPVPSSLYDCRGAAAALAAAAR